MLITFKTKSHANIVMFGQVAQRILEMMNFGTDVPGAILAKDVAQALDNLQQALKTVDEIVESETENDDDQQTVSIHTRALPLIELLQSAVDDENNVGWS